MMRKLARKNCKIIFLQDLIKIFQENHLGNCSCKILTRFFIFCKKSFIFSARLVYLQDLVQDLANLARKILARFGYFLQDGFYWVIYIIYISSQYCYISYKCCTAIKETHIPSEMCLGETRITDGKYQRSHQIKSHSSFVTVAKRVSESIVMSSYEQKDGKYASLVICIRGNTYHYDTGYPSKRL